jgi:hypothetical protein
MQGLGSPVRLLILVAIAVLALFAAKKAAVLLARPDYIFV